VSSAPSPRRAVLAAAIGVVVLFGGVAVVGFGCTTGSPEGGPSRLAGDPPLPADVTFLLAELTSGDRARVQRAAAPTASDRQVAVLTARYAGLRAAGLELRVLEMAHTDAMTANVRLSMFDRSSGDRVAASEAGLQVLLDGGAPVRPLPGVRRRQPRMT